MENMKTVCSIGGGDGVCVFVCTGDGGGVKSGTKFYSEYILKDATININSISEAGKLLCH